MIHFNGRKWRGTKEPLLMRVKEESEKGSLKLNIKKTKIMASSVTTPWQIEGEKFETVIDFLFLSTKITANGDCSHEIRWLLLGRKTMTNLDGLLKSKDITLPTKVHIIKAVVFPVAMYGCESWTIKTECRRTDVFELWCWRRLLRAPWNQPWILIGRTDAETESPIFWPPDAKSWIIGKEARRWERLKAGGEGGDRGWDG